MAGKKADERLGDKKKKQQMMIFGVLGGLGLLIVLAAGFVLLNGGQAAGNPAVFNASPMDADGQNVAIPASDIGDTAFHFYSYNSGGTEIKYFVVKDKNGELHTAFDACDVCYRAQKGYMQAGDYAKCNNCGKSFSISDIGTKNKAGGCWPGYLPHQIRGDSIVIKTSDLEGGKYRFN